MKVDPSNSKNILDLLMGSPRNNRDNPNEEKKFLDALTIISLPSRLRKTAIELHRIKRATAAMIAKETGEEEREERAHLEELFQMGYLKKIKEESELFFCLN